MAGNIISWYWEFGDGFTSNEQNPEHTYFMPGSYKWKLTVTDDTGRTSTVTGTITVRDWGVDGSDLDVSVCNKCYRLGFSRRQGIGWSECTGSAWPFPEARVGILKIYDGTGYPRLLVLNWNDGRFYDITTKDGPSGSGLSRALLDGVLTDGSGGTAITPSVEFREDKAPSEEDTIRARKLYVYTRPYDEDYRGVSGYDSNGYPTGLTLQADVYVDGERQTAKATAESISLPKHRITYDKQVEGARILTKLTGNMAPFSIIGRKFAVVDVIREDDPDSMVTTEDTYQSEVALPYLWVGYYGGVLRDLTDGDVLSVSGATQASGVDGRNRAISFDGQVTVKSVALTSASILLWVKGEAGPVTLNLTINDETVSLSTHDIYGDWRFYYATGVTKTGDLKLAPSSDGIELIVDDLKIVNSATVSSGARSYYFSDVENNSGNVVLRKS